MVIGPVIHTLGGPIESRLSLDGKALVIRNAPLVLVEFDVDVDGVRRRPNRIERADGLRHRCHMSFWGQQGVCAGWAHWGGFWGFHTWREQDGVLHDMAWPPASEYIGAWSAWPRRAGKHRRRG